MIDLSKVEEHKPEIDLISHDNESVDDTAHLNVKEIPKQLEMLEKFVKLLSSKIEPMLNPVKKESLSANSKTGQSPDIPRAKSSREFKTTISLANRIKPVPIQDKAKKESIVNCIKKYY